MEIMSQWGENRLHHYWRKLLQKWSVQAFADTEVDSWCGLMVSILVYHYFEWMKFKLKCTILVKLQSDIHKERALLHEEHHLDCSISLPALFLVFWWTYLTHVCIFLVQHQITPTAHPRILCSLRTSIVTWNTELSLKGSLHCDHRSDVFEFQMHGKAMMFSNLNHADYWNGVTDRTEGDHLHLPSPGYSHLKTT